MAQWNAPPNAYPRQAAPPPASGDSTDTIAMVLEILFGLFGILGMGWLYAGRIMTGVLAFFGYLVLVAIEVVVVSATFGFAACITLPLNLAVVVISGIKARDYVRRAGARGSVVYVLAGLVGGVIIACLVIFLLASGLGLLSSLSGNLS